MKTILTTLALALLLSSCAPGIDTFYESHKNDPGVTAVEVPDFVIELFKNGSSDLNLLLEQVEDIKFMSLPPNAGNEASQLANEINRITATGYTDVYRRTDTDYSLSLFSVKEERERIKELIWFDQGNTRNLLLYFKGNFDPELISRLSDTKEVENLKEILDNQY